MKKYIVGGAILILLLVLGLSAKNIVARGGFVTPGTPSSDEQTLDPLSNDDTVASTTGNIQNAKLALVDFSYTLTPNTLVKGVPARIEVDASTLSGCMKNVVIDDFGVRKTIRPGDNIIEFTPDKTGTFWITCSMGMGPGSFSVVEAAGSANTDGAPVNAASAPAPLQPSRPSANSCGMGGGGCGCGG